MHSTTTVSLFPLISTTRHVTKGKLFTESSLDGTIATVGYGATEAT